MTLLTSFISRILLPVSFFGMALSSGCAHYKGTVSPEQSPSVTGPMRIVVLPVENLSGKEAPLDDLRKAIVDRMAANGLSVLGDEAGEEFMTRHRMRYTGGLDASMAKAFRDEERTDAVLIVSLEFYLESDNPKISLISRLVSTGDTPTIIWMKSVAIAGNDSPGLLGLGLITDPLKLRARAIETLAASLEE